MSTIYKSDALINSLQHELGLKFSAKNRSAMQKIIRGYFIQVHIEAVEATEMAKNRQVNYATKYEKPNFND